MKNHQPHTVKLSRSIGTWEVMVAGVALVVASSTLVSEFTGYFTLGAAFCVALLVGFVINLLLAVSAADLSVAYPRAGALYDYAKGIFHGPLGEFVGVFLGLAFFGMFMFAASGETAAGAFGLQALTGLDLHINWFIVICSAMAVVPNIFGLKTTAWVSAALLLLMLGIRWFFGLTGFLGISHTGAWFVANLNPGVGVFDWFGSDGLLASGLAMAFWSFVGIEFACSLAEEVKQPRKAMPRGMIYGLLAILGTSWILLYGVFHLLAIINRIWRPQTAAVFDRRWLIPAAVLGVFSTGVSLYYAFAGTHAEFGLRALIVLGAALVAAGVSFVMPSTIAWKLPTGSRKASVGT